MKNRNLVLGKLKRAALLFLLIFAAGISESLAQPQGVVNGVFSVSETKQVYFSQGNLQYIGSASTPYWKFAEHQWDYLGNNGQASESETVDRDLFGWGTSGYNHGAVCYQPWSTDSNCEYYYAYNTYYYNLYNQTCQADWGYNPISNGGDTENSGWRTLKQSEWEFVFDKRITVSGIRYAKAKVNDVNGVIILPDNWNTNTYSLTNTNQSSASFSSNNISDTQWITLEQAGAVFLPAAGNRWGYWSVSAGSYGNYWSASCSGNSNAYKLSFDDENLQYKYNIRSRNGGISVRLVRPVEKSSYSIQTVPTPEDGGMVNGGGSYPAGAECTLTAIPTEGFTFVYWAENDEVVSTEATYSFTVTEDRIMVANFVGSNGGTGLLNGMFSVAENTQVNFSQGNLQYRAITDTWRFAENQWDFVGGTDYYGYENNHFGTVEGSCNNDASPIYSGWIDLFGWGTSGNEHGAVCYQPWGISQNNSDYYAYGSSTYNLNDSTGQADWGYNAISNGGNTTGRWRTLSQAEWHYLLFERATISGMRYVLATVNGIEGLILLPDTWDSSIYYLYGGISINSTTWTSLLESNGAVFLPAAGERYPENPYEEEEGDWRYVNWGSGQYWATTYYDNNDAYYMYFDYYQNSYPSDVSATTIAGRLCGLSVRLVKTIQPTSYNISTIANPFEGGSVTGAGEYEPNEVCTLTAIPNEGYTFINWTENGEMVSLEAVYSFTVIGDRSLVANFTAGSESYTISVSANPSNGGTVTGAGMFNQGEDATLTATSNTNYTFMNWTKNGEVVSTETTYSFTVTENATYVANFSWACPSGVDYVSDGLIMYVDGIYNTRNGHSTTTNVWEDLVGNYDLAVSEYDSYSWEGNHFIGHGNAGYLNTGHTWQYFNSLNNDLTIEVVTYIDCDKTSPAWRGLAGWHLDEYGTNFQNDQGGNRMESLGGIPMSDVDDEIATVSYTRLSGAFLNGEWKVRDQRLHCGVNSSLGVVFGNSFQSNGVGQRGWNDSIYCIRMYNRSLTPEEIAHNHSIDMERFGAGLNNSSMLNGLFSVSDSTQVRFSQGNLQYQASTNTWRFAENQWDYIGTQSPDNNGNIGGTISGSDNNNISPYYEGWVDLFCWGTSGYNHGAICYQPWSTSRTYSDYYIYGSSTYNLYDQTGQADWGYNAISNGGNTLNQWRTLSYPEWDYLCNTRNTSSGIRYAVGNVNSVNGIILLPDNWETSYYTLNNPNSGNYSSNTISLEDWINVFEAHGAVFLPAAGWRPGVVTYDINNVGNYWSSSYADDWCAYFLRFYEDEFDTGYYWSLRGNGHSVRLVSTMQCCISAVISPVESGTVIGIGDYSLGQLCTLTAIPNEGYIFLNWTKDGEVVSTDSDYSFIVTEAVQYTANFEQVQGVYIGDFGTVTNEYLPNTCFNYSLSQQIYSADEIGGALNITELSFFNGGTERTHNYDIYLVHTDKMAFDNASDWITVSEFDRVFSGEVTMTRGYWTTITLDVAFAYNGISNLALIVDENSNEWSSASMTCRVFNANGNQALRIYGENHNFDPYNPTQYGGTLRGIKNQIIFNRNTVVNYFISATANPAVGGTVSGSGSYQQGQTCTLTATPNEGYAFVNWTENGTMVSIDANYSFIVTSNRDLVANFAVYGGNYGYVDLGLPSGLLWATCNVGANSPEDYGDYFAWGETEPKEIYLMETYQYGYYYVDPDDIQRVYLSKYNTDPQNGPVDGLTTLLPMDDAATVNWGLDWRMPTQAEWAELCQNTTSTWITQNGVEGMLYTAENGNSIFLPATGFRSDELIGVGEDGAYWSSSLVTNSTEGAWRFIVWDCQSWFIFDYRFFGHTIRAVRSSVPSIDFAINAVANPIEGGTVNGMSVYAEGSACTLTAVPNAGYTFINWTKDGEVVSTEATFSFTVVEEGDYVANFELNSYDIMATANPTEGGTVEGMGVYYHFETCTLTATASTGYHFLNWTKDGEVVMTDAAYSFTVTEASAFVANFELNSYAITATANPTEGGTITGPGIYNHFETCTLTATANVGFHFLNWTKDGEIVTTEATYIFEVAGPADYVANFELNSYDITAVANPEAGGSVEGAGTYNHFATCTLTATASTGYHFVNWTLDSEEVSTEPTYSFEVTGPASYVANFELNSYDITAMVNPEAGGTVDGAGTYNHFDTCTLTATANTGYHFVNWTLDGEEVATTLTYSIEVAGHADYIANFELNTYEITATANPEAGGTVEGAGTYEHFSTCTLTATANTGYHFVNWTLVGEVVSNSPTYNFEVTGTANYVANFELNNYEIAASASPEAGGTVTGAGTYTPGETCTLTATANEGYAFVNWTRNGAVVSVEAEYSFTVTEEANFMANFELNSYAITATASPSEGGTVTGGGTYYHFENATLSAIANEGYHFVNWTLGGEVVSNSPTYSFTVTEAADFVAHFAVNAYNVFAMANPSVGGTVSGAGAYDYGETVTLTATPNANYSFVSWTENGVVVSTEATYSFTVEGSRSLVANFSHEYHWNADPFAYESTMTIIGIVQINGEEQYSNLLEVGAFSGEECRGREWLTDQYYVDFGHYLVFLTVYGDNDSADEITFRLYDHATNEEVDKTCVTTLLFESDAIYGSNANPFVFNFIDANVAQTSNLSNGWNWWSSYIELDDNSLAVLQNGLGTSGMMIKSQNDGYASYLAGFGWYGSLTTINNENTYQIRASEACTVEITGAMANPADHPIMLNSGWTWIGYPVSTSMTITEALSGIEPQTSDMLKSQNDGFASYLDGFGWYGSLNILNPGMGLMFKSNNANAVTLVYPTNGTRTDMKANQTTESNYWQPNLNAYPDNMSVMAVVELDGNELQGENYELAAFANGEVRGSVRLLYVEPLNRYIAFLTVAGDEAAELHFGLYNAETGKVETQCTTSLQYETNAVIGSFVEPYIVSFRGTTGVDEQGSGLRLYPNPAKDAVCITGLETATEVLIFNSLGELVKATTASPDSGIGIGDLANGLYLIRCGNVSLRFMKE